jgi:PilZ domain
MDNMWRPHVSKSGANRLAGWGCDAVNECRRGRRMPYHTAVELNTSAGPAKGTIRNISIGGLFVDTKTPLSVGQKFEMNFRFRSGNHAMKLLAQVVRETKEGLGVKLL